MSEHHRPPELTHDYRTHELLQAILREVDELRADARLTGRLQQIEALLQTLIGVGEATNQRLDALIILLTPPQTYPQATHATVA